jgi:hypothetical protein
MTSAVIVNLETAEVVVEDVDEAELAELAIKRAAWESDRPRRDALAEISHLEASITDRMWREDATGSTALMGFGSNDPRTGKTATQYIAWVDAQCASLRAQLLS